MMSKRNVARVETNAGSPGWLQLAAYPPRLSLKPAFFGCFIRTGEALGLSDHTMSRPESFHFSFHGFHDRSSSNFGIVRSARAGV